MVVWLAILAHGNRRVCTDDQQEEVAPTGGATSRGIAANCLWLHPDGLAIDKGDRDVHARDVLVRGDAERGERCRAPSEVEAPQCTEDM